VPRGPEGTGDDLKKIPDWRGRHGSQPTKRRRGETKTGCKLPEPGCSRSPGGGGNEEGKERFNCLSTPLSAPERKKRMLHLSRNEAILSKGFSLTIARTGEKKKGF